MILPLPFAPMEARSVDSIPVGEAWRYEPKWDGFRCLALLQRIHPALPPTLVRWARRIAVNIDKLPELWRKSDQANTWAEKQNAAARNRALQP